MPPPNIYITKVPIQHYTKEKTQFILFADSNNNPMIAWNKNRFLLKISQMDLITITCKVRSLSNANLTFSAQNCPSIKF